MEKEGEMRKKKVQKMMGEESRTKEKREGHTERDRQTTREQLTEAMLLSTRIKGTSIYL